MILTELCLSTRTILSALTLRHQNVIVIKMSPYYINLHSFKKQVALEKRDVGQSAKRFAQKGGTRRNLYFIKYVVS